MDDITRFSSSVPDNLFGSSTDITIMRHDEIVDHYVHGLEYSVFMYTPEYDILQPKEKGSVTVCRDGDQLNQTCLYRSLACCYWFPGKDGRECCLSKGTKKVMKLSGGYADQPGDDSNICAFVRATGCTVFVCVNLEERGYRWMGFRRDDVTPISSNIIYLYNTANEHYCPYLSY